MLWTTCPVCRRPVPVAADLDGLNCPRPDGPWRIVVHAGKQWGRICKGGRELVELAQTRSEADEP